MSIWQPFATIPRDGKEWLVLRPQQGPTRSFPELDVVHFDSEREKFVGRDPAMVYAEGVIADTGFGMYEPRALWAPVDTIPGRDEERPWGGWATMESAPRDGDWFIRLHWITHVGRGAPYPFTTPRLNWLHRARRSPTSDGYWMGQSCSVGDFDSRRGFWTRTELPLPKPETPQSDGPMTEEV